ncbi:Voltage-gated ion channel, partial [Globisporangium splendens]
MVLEAPKFLRLWQLPKYLLNLDNLYAKHFEALKLFKLVVGIILVSHSIACIRFSFGYDVHHYNHWLPKVPDEEQSPASRNLMSLLWVFGILSGLFEGELPHSVLELIFTIFVARCGFSIFTSLCATFFMTSKCKSGQAEAAEGRINQLKHILGFHQVSESLQAQAVEYLRLYYTDADSNEREVMKLLCPSIATDNQVELMKDTIARVPLFSDCNDGFVVALTSLLQRVSLPAQCTLFQAGDFGDAMYIIHSGVLDVIVGKAKVRELRKNDFVGELSLFSSSPRTATVVTTTYCVLYKLSRFHTEKVLDGYPRVARSISIVVKRFLEKTQEQQAKGNQSSSAPGPAAASSDDKANAQTNVRREPVFRAPLSRLVIPDIKKKSSNAVTPILIMPAGSPHKRSSAAPLMRRVLTGKVRKGSDSIKVFYGQYTGSSTVTKTKRWWSVLLLEQCIDADSTRRLWWLLVLQVVLVTNWVLIPLQLAFDLFDGSTWYIPVLNILIDIALYVDIYVNFNHSYMHDAEKILDPIRSAIRYLRSTFLLDLLCAIPYTTFAPSVHLAITRIPRLFSVTHSEGFNSAEDSWIPCDDIELRRLPDGMYIDHVNVTYNATDPHVLEVARMQLEPISDIQYMIALLFMFSGFLITAVVVDNVQKRFTASAFEEKEFFAIRSQIQLFLRRQKAPFAIHQRVNTFLDYWWASHRGALIEELLVDLPLGYRREILRSVCKPALQTLALLPGVHEVLYREGDNAYGLIFLVEDNIALTSSDNKPKDVPQGGCFGTRSLQTDETHAGYAETATASSGCVVLFLTRQKLEISHEIFPALKSALTRLEKRLLNTKLSKSVFSNHAGSSSHGKNSSWFIRVITCQSNSIDPHSVLVILHICFGVDEANHGVVDGITVMLEVFFLIDLYVRARLGYHEFGNKVMNLAKIRRRFFRSWTFMIDLVALLPFFMLNWILPTTNRLENFNINKLVRVLKVPMQFQALEQRYLKFAMELRLFKLLYHTFLLAHVFGSLYFDFASHASQLYLLGSGETPKTNFGTNKWLPGASVETAEPSLQYFSSVFWVFGLMSTSQQGELPKTSVQCIFSVVTMISGFFLFAYVVGNFADIIELVDAENREFNEKLGSMRHLLAHFTLPPSIEAKMKTFFFFKRFHSITQEKLLERCLPPSLMTDIRLINLHTMIQKVPFLGNMEESITRMLVSHFSQVLILKDDYVYRQGDEGTDMYFVFTGILTVLLPMALPKRSDCRGKSRASISRAGGTIEVDVKSLKQLSEITLGDFFGENALFSDNPRNEYVRARTSCILYSLSRHSLEMVFELYPDWEKRVLQTVKVQQKQQRLNAPTNDRQQQVGNSNSISSTGEDAAAENDEDVSYDQLEEIAASPRKNLQPIAVLEDWQRFLPRCVFSLIHGVEAQSQLHIIWLFLIATTTGYVAVIDPYRIAFDSCERWTGFPIAVNLLEILCTLLFPLDVWINWRLKESEISIEIYEEKHRDSYKAERLMWDVLAALPIDYMLSLAFAEALWIRLFRCIKVKKIVHYMNEINRQSVSYEWASFKTIWVLYLLVMYWSACAYLMLSSDEGESVVVTVVASLLPPTFFAVTAFVKKCRTFVPESTLTSVFSILICFVGLLVMLFMIGEISSLYISYIGNEVKFRKDQIGAELYLSRWKIDYEMKTFFSIALKLAKKLFNDLCELHNGEIPKSRDVWASHLKKILVRQRMEWALSLTSSPSNAGTLAEVDSLDTTPPTNLPFSSTSPMSGATTGSALPKGATLWSAVLAGVLDTDTPYTCLQMFEAFLELIVPVGELYERTVMTAAASPRGAGTNGGAAEMRLKNTVQQIGTSRLRMKGVAQKLSRQSDQSM